MRSDVPRRYGDSRRTPRDSRGGRNVCGGHTLSTRLDWPRLIGRSAPDVSNPARRSAARQRPSESAWTPPPAAFGPISARVTGRRNTREAAARVGGQDVRAEVVRFPLTGRCVLANFPLARLHVPSRLTRGSRMVPASAHMSTASAARRRSATDPLTRRALARVRHAPPHERLLALAGCTVSELATRLVPEVSRSRLRAVLEQAEVRGRMTRYWAERLGHVVDASAEDVLALFSIDSPTVRGRPRTVGEPGRRTRL